MALINPKVGAAMAETLERVNGDITLEAVNELLKKEIRRLESLLEKRETQITYWRDEATSLRETPRVAIGISGAHGSLIIPKLFAAQRHTSISTVNRALNADPPELLGVRQPNNHWLVYEDQPWIPKRKRGRNAQ